MDLAKFSQMEPEQGGGSFLKFTPSDNIKVVRFMYTADPAVDEELGIRCRKKYFDPTTRKVIWDTEEGKWTMGLKVAVYTSKTEYQHMTWDRSAAFGRDNLLPLFESAGGRIMDTVYKITCSKAGTLDASYTFFPLKDSDQYALPTIVSDEDEVDASASVDDDVFGGSTPAPVPQASRPSPTPAKSAPAPSKPVTAPKRKQFWEE